MIRAGTVVMVIALVSASSSHRSIRRASHSMVGSALPLGQEDPPWSERMSSHRVNRVTQIRWPNRGASC
jgi:hypothetical protein